VVGLLALVDGFANGRIPGWFGLDKKEANDEPLTTGDLQLAARQKRAIVFFIEVPSMNQTISSLALCVLA
jgi:hypothetical protein